jgi:hypothetical protein
MQDLFCDIIGWAGSLLLIVSILQTRIERLRWLNLVACAVPIVYNVWLMSWPMIAMNSALIAINLYNLNRLRAGRNDRAALTQPSPPAPEKRSIASGCPLDRSQRHHSSN